MEIDISDIGRPAALAALYNASRPQGLGLLHYTPDRLTEEEAAAVLAGSAYVDYLRGRVIKVSFASDTIRTHLYDRDNGPGAGATAIDAARKERS